MKLLAHGSLWFQSRPYFMAGFALVLVACASSGQAPSTNDRPLTKPPAEASPAPELVSFPAAGATLQGWIYQPAGRGPFPAILYNHGSEKDPGWFPTLGKFWVGKGYVFFVPHRRGHGRSPGNWIVELQQQFRAKESDATLTRKHDIELHEQANLDVEAAVAWLRHQPYVNTNAMVMSGISYGGIQTVLAAEKGLGLKAFVPFSPGAMAWAGNPLLRERLLQAVKNAQAPMFLLQAQNDYNLGPSELLGAELKRKGPPNRMRVYPAFGDKNNPRDGHGGFAVRGSDVWGAAVVAFLDEVLKR